MVDMKNFLAVGVAVAVATTLLSDERQFTQALIRWERTRSLPSLLHVATSGFFLAEDVTALVA
jgi:hypothetical protein